jgi:hypothetical protein
MISFFSTNLEDCFVIELNELDELFYHRITRIKRIVIFLFFVLIRAIR